MDCGRNNSTTTDENSPVKKEQEKATNTHKKSDM